MIKRVLKRLLGHNTYERRIAYLSKKNLNRALGINHYFSLVKDIKGDVVECGVGEGYGQCLLLHFGELYHRSGNLWAFDSFEGFPDLSASDKRDYWFVQSLKEYKMFDIPFVMKSLTDYGHEGSLIDRKVKFVKGFIPESLKFYDGSPIAFLHLDLDIYEGYRDSLEFFWDIVVSGGLIAFDEYLKPMDTYKWPGAAKAVHEFLERKGLVHLLQFNPYSGNPYIIKP